MNAKHAKNVRVRMKKGPLKNRANIFLLCLSLSLILVFSGASSFAWMYTAQKKDTITFNKVSLSTSVVDVKGQQLIPGKTYTLSAAPTVTVAANSIACYLFVHITGDGVSQFDAFTMASGWTKYGSTTYYYRSVAKKDSDQSFQILANDQIKAKTTLEHTSGTLAGGDLFFDTCAVQSGGSIGIDAAYTEAAKVI